MLRLDSEVQYVKGVGPKRAALLGSRGIRTVYDLLLRLPRLYQDRSRFTPIDALCRGQEAMVRAKIYRSRTTLTRSRGRILELAVTDGQSFAYAKWFHGSYLQKNTFIPGREIVIFGKVDYDAYNRQLVFFNPEFETLDDGEDGHDSLDTGRFVPIYEEAAGITSRQFRRITAAALRDLAPIEDPLPEEIRRRLELPDLSQCLHRLHYPETTESLERLNARASPYHNRLVFEEFLLLELVLMLRRQNARISPGIQFETNDALREQIKRILPFHPTSAQKRALREIVEDLRAPYPMNRLLQGDVGSGKTLVAFEAMVVAVENGYQAVLMAPTEILAEQHYWNATRVLAPLAYRIGLLKQGLRKAQKQQLLEEIACGAMQIVIGTHAVLEDQARIPNLGLVVIDEQHRFGVVQRMKLMSKGRHPNTLVMTATPIPRTLAMALYGDLDISVIDEMPPGRTPIETLLFGEPDRSQVVSLIRRAVASGRQCYVVFPVIEDSEKVDMKSATTGCQRIREALPELRVELLHGRLKSSEKESLMKDFAAGSIHVLAATTVVEVGVDVPNATLIVIENADRFGLSQLHQLRGRVGRGSAKSTCVLVSPVRLGDAARDRLKAMVQTTDGFRLAEIDLRQRGPGELAGTRQSGMPEFRVANLLEDTRWLAAAQQEAKLWMDRVEERDRLIRSLSSRFGTAAPSALVQVG